MVASASLRLPGRPFMSVTRSRRSRWGLSLMLVTVFAALASSYGDVPASLRPGPLGGGITLLPNGWKIAPAGRHVQVGSLPLAMVESPDGRSLFIASNGYMKPALTIVDIKSRRVSDVIVLDHAWLGLAWHPDGKRLYVSGAGNTTVHEMQFAGDKLTRGSDLVLGRPMPTPTEGAKDRKSVV